MQITQKLSNWKQRVNSKQVEDGLIKANISTCTSLDEVCHKLEKTNNPRGILKIKIWGKVYRRISSKAWIPPKSMSISLPCVLTRLHISLSTCFLEI